jgi:hypothetical protein
MDSLVNNFKKAESIDTHLAGKGDTGYTFSVMIFWAVRKPGGRLASDLIVAVPPSYPLFGRILRFKSP